MLKTMEQYGHTPTMGTETCTRCGKTSQQLEEGLRKYWSEDCVCWGAPLIEKHIISLAARHDFNYMYSDDYGAYLRGKHSWKELQDLISSGQAGTRGELLARAWRETRIGLRSETPE